MQSCQPYFNYLKRENSSNLTDYTDAPSYLPLEHPLAIDTSVSLQENCYYYYCSENSDHRKTYDPDYPFHNSFSNLFEDMLECNSALSSPEIMPTQSPLYSDYMSTASFSPSMTTLMDSRYIPENSILSTGSEFYQTSVARDCSMEYTSNNFVSIKEDAYSNVYPEESYLKTQVIDTQELEFPMKSCKFSCKYRNSMRISRGRSSSSSSSSSNSSSENESCQTPASDTPSYSFDNYTLAISSDSRPYSCHFCSRAFARKHDLQRHIRVHTGEKPYSCPCCKKAFSRTDALKRHLRMEERCKNSQEVYEMKKNGKRRYRNL